MSDHNPRPTKKITPLLAVASSSGDIYFIDKDKALRGRKLPPDASESIVPLIRDLSLQSSALKRTAAVVIEMDDESDTMEAGTDEPVRTHTDHGESDTHERVGKRIRTSVAGIPVYVHVQRDEAFARVILKPLHQEDCLCLIFAMLNCVDSQALRDALNFPFTDKPGFAFYRYFRKADNSGYGGENGYSSGQAIMFLQSLLERGVISSWTFKRLKRYEVTDLLTGARRLESGDNMIIFGRAKTTVTESKVKKSMDAAEKKARKQGKSAAEVKKIVTDVMVKRGVAVTKPRVNPRHAVGVRFRTNANGEPFAEIVDPAKSVSRPLTPREYAGCLSEMYRTDREKKLENSYYVFRIELPGANV